MAAAGGFPSVSSDQFQCCICLDVFTNPVTIPCGHNFCKNCITEHWNINVQIQCPLCQKLFDKQPELHVNTVMSEMAAQVRQMQISNLSECQQTKPGEILCDVCTEVREKARKSCLMCLVSYCEIHLEPHQRITGLKRHKLIDPVRNLEGRICRKHDRPLELFCKTDQLCVCQFCAESSHKEHCIVPLKNEYKEKKGRLGKMEGEIKQFIEVRRKKIKELEHSVTLVNEDTNRELADSVQVFMDITQSVEDGLAHLIDVFEGKQRATEGRVKGFIKELEMEIFELMEKSSELEQLSHTDDQLYFLQSFMSLNVVHPDRDWTQVRVHSSYEGTLRIAVARLQEMLCKKMKKVLKAELKRVQQFMVNVTLNPQTAYPKLILSANGKQVSHGDVRLNVPDNPERFSSCCGVLGNQSFSSGRFYYEVQVREKTEWTLGVARESINRKGEIKVCPRNGYWTMWLRNENVYSANSSPPVHLSLKSKPQKVGVFVDYEQGVVSFYDVDAEDLIYSFTGCKFTEKLYPYFSPCLNDGGKNSAPLTILPFKKSYMSNE